MLKQTSWASPKVVKTKGLQSAKIGDAIKVSSVKQIRGYPEQKTEIDSLVITLIMTGSGPKVTRLGLSDETHPPTEKVKRGEGDRR